MKAIKLSAKANMMARRHVPYTQNVHAGQRGLSGADNLYVSRNSKNRRTNRSSANRYVDMD